MIDSDDDGVIDSFDQCPNSAPNSVVDERGCAMDNDRDGVSNDKDKCPDTAAGKKVNINGCQVIEETVRIKLNVEFANNSDVISKEYHQEISKIADFMLKYPTTKTVIEGHTDNRGNVNYNLDLSSRRATAVKNYLVSIFNISADRLSAVGYGPSSPIGSNDTAEGRQKNRRVVAEIKEQVVEIK